MIGKLFTSFCTVACALRTDHITELDVATLGKEIEEINIAAEERDAAQDREEAFDSKHAEEAVEYLEMALKILRSIRLIPQELVTEIQSDAAIPFKQQNRQEHSEFDNQGENRQRRGGQIFEKHEKQAMDHLLQAKKKLHEYQREVEDGVEINLPVYNTLTKIEHYAEMIEREMQNKPESPRQQPAASCAKDGLEDWCSPLDHVVEEEQTLPDHGMIY